MNHLVRIQQIFERHRRNRTWYGPTIGQLIENISAEKAHEILPGGHSVWQIVRHSIVWRDLVCAAIDGEPYTMPGDEQNWPNLSDTSETAWSETRADLQRSYDSLALLIAKLSEDKLDSYVDDQRFTISDAIHGIFEHDAYHAGQIAVLINAMDVNEPTDI